MRNPSRSCALLLTMIAAAPAARLQATPPGSAPVAASAPVFCAQPEFDLGDQPAGAVLSHAFTLRNPLDRPVSLALTNHAGLTVDGVPASLAAGQAVAVTLTPEPLGGLGEFSYVADFTVDGAPAPACTLEVHGRVLQFFRTDPPDQHLLLTIAPGRSGRRRFTLERKDGQPFSVSALRWEEAGGGELTGNFSLTAESEPGRAAAWNGWIAAGPLARPGLYYARLHLATDHPRQPEVVIDAVIRNLSPLVIFPGEIHFFTPVKRADLAAGKAPVRRLFVHALPGEPRFTAGAVAVEPAFLTARWVTEGSPRKDDAVLEIGLKPDAPPGAFRGEVRIARSTAAGDEERVEVEGVVQP